MTGPITFEFAASVVSVVVIAIGIVLWVFREFGKRDATTQRNATMLATALSDFKLHIAETYVTKTGLTESLSQINDAIKQLTSRIDAILERRAEPGPPPRSRRQSGD